MRKLATWVTVAAGLVCMVVVVVGLKVRIPGFSYYHALPALQPAHFVCL